MVEELRLIKRKAFSMIEILIAIVVMSVALLSFFIINQSSNSKSMDAYYEFLGESLGSETIDFCRGMGYNWAMKYLVKPDIFPLNKWHNCLEYPIFGKTTYFRECGSFERKVNFSKVKLANEEGIFVTVEIRTKEDTKVKSWLSRNKLYFSTMIEKVPQR